MSENINYKDTINLPKTSFSMKANLTQKEPQMQKQWEKEDIYGQIRQAGKGKEKYILHDGPPYANGNVHIGTGLNKILKDIIVKFKTMQGFDSPYVPGWDCHGLPIEHKVAQELGETMKDLSVSQIRARCKRYAEKYIDIQRKQFKSLGVFGDWQKPYLTIDHSYEAGIIDIFSKLVERGFVYKKLKPIHWCMSCKTALAEAELEYKSHTSPSLYVRFKITNGLENIYTPEADEDVYILIWTTTPWTLPANLAVAVSPVHTYSFVQYNDAVTNTKATLILADNLVEKVMQTLSIEHYEKVHSVSGNELAGLMYEHPFMDRGNPIIHADFVSLEDGCGCVHIAPGHGQEDYEVGLLYNLDILSPVDEKGVFTNEAGKYEGFSITEADKIIVDDLTQSGHLLFSQKVPHAYPHCWRCKNPVIFRATTQWFINVDHNGLRKKVLDKINNIGWVPNWGQIRITSMLEDRPDWCISRQRFWGVPIPAFYCKQCGNVIITREIVDFAKELFRQKGSDSWFELDEKDLHPAGLTCEKCGGKEFRKETDILDVWFESGSSHRAVLAQHPDLHFPAELYLEGTDQHRGWFQASILTAVGALDEAPFKTVLTHGFVVDENGQKMSKSLGNLIDAQEATKKFGADIVRLWISSVDYKNDINVSKDIIAKLSDAYRRIRNTLRYLLGNTYDFDEAADAVAYEELLEIDTWALAVTQKLIKDVTRAYEEFQFHKVYGFIHNFCVVQMSSFYLDVLKDRLYTAGKKSIERRSAQTVLREIFSTITRLLAPILVHTSEEAWKTLQDGQDSASVHLASWPVANDDYIDEELLKTWGTLLAVRGEVTRQLETLRAQNIIGNSLEATVEVFTQDKELFSLLKKYSDELATLFIVSSTLVTLSENAEAAAGRELTTISVLAKKSTAQKCVRCWNYRSSVGENASHPQLCARCVQVIEEDFEKEE